MKTKAIQWIKEHLNMYNIGIIIAILIIIISLIVIFREDIGKIAKKETKKTVDGIEVVETKTKQDEEISEEDAKKIAVKQFKNLGENVKKDDLDIIRIQRSGEKFYYVTSSENTLEIKIIGGQITRINSVPVEQ